MTSAYHCPDANEGQKTIELGHDMKATIEQDVLDLNLVVLYPLLRQPRRERTTTTTTTTNTELKPIQTRTKIGQEHFSIYTLHTTDDVHHSYAIEEVQPQQHNCSREEEEEEANDKELCASFECDRFCFSEQVNNVTATTTTTAPASLSEIADDSSSSSSSTSLSTVSCPVIDESSVEVKSNTQMSPMSPRNATITTSSSSVSSVSTSSVRVELRSFRDQLMYLLKDPSNFQSTAPAFERMWPNIQEHLLIVLERETDCLILAYLIKLITHTHIELPLSYWTFMSSFVCRQCKGQLNFIVELIAFLTSVNHMNQQFLARNDFIKNARIAVCSKQDTLRQLRESQGEKDKNKNNKNNKALGCLVHISSILFISMMFEKDNKINSPNVLTAQNILASSHFHDALDRCTWYIDIAVDVVVNYNCPEYNPSEIMYFVKSIVSSIKSNIDQRIKEDAIKLAISTQPQQLNLDAEECKDDQEARIIQCESDIRHRIQPTMTTQVTRFNQIFAVAEMRSDFRDFSQQQAQT